MNRDNVLDRLGLLSRIWGFVKWTIGVNGVKQTRDCFVGGDVQEAAAAVAAGCGWQDELNGCFF
jgi:hypothetical protein